MYPISHYSPGSTDFAKVISINTYLHQQRDTFVWNRRQTSYQVKKDYTLPEPG